MRRARRIIFPLLAAAVLAASVLFHGRKTPPPPESLSSRAASLGWEQHPGFQEDDGAGVLYLDRHRNPGATEYGGAAQPGALFVVDRGTANSERYRVADGPDSGAMATELFTPSR